MCEIGWKGWSIIWLFLLTIPSLLIYFGTKDVWMLALSPLTLILVYELLFIRVYLARRKIGLRSKLETKMEYYEPKEEDYGKISEKLAISVQTVSAMAAIAGLLFIGFSLFSYFIPTQIGLNVESFLLLGMMTTLIISAICNLICLDQYDTAADPSLDINIKWEMRKRGKEYFVLGWYLLLFGIFTGLSLVHPLLTLISCTGYVTVHNRFWFQSF